MQVSVGQRLASTVCEAEVIVIRVGSDELDLHCGGAPLTVVGSPDAHAGTQLTEPDGAGAVLGKRYVDGDGQVELLCTKAGYGALALGGTVLTLKSAKTLPSSD